MKHTILWTMLAILLLISACSINKGNSVGVVNGKRILYEQFIEAYRGHYENFYTETGRAPDIEEKKALEQSTWTNITKFVILQEQYRKYKISVTHQEVIDSLIANPPSYILSSPWFIVNGIFDRASYLQSLQFDSPYNLRPVRRQYYDNEIPLRKLKVKLIDNEFLTRKERGLVTRALRGAADIDWLVFDADKQDIRISDADVEAYYQANLQSYLLEPYFSVSYSLVPTRFSEADMAYSIGLQDSVLYDLSLGLSLESVVNSVLGRRQEITLSDTGYLSIPDLPQEIKADVLDLQVGQLSAPIRSVNSIDIYRMEHKTRSMVKLSKLQIPIKAREASIAEARRLALNFRELARMMGFEAAVDEMDLELYQAERFSPGESWLGDTSMEEQFLQRLENASINTILTPQYSSKHSAWVVVQLRAKQNREPKSLALVRSEINDLLIKDRKLDVVRQQARMWLESSMPAYQVSPTSDQYSLHRSTLHTFDSRLDSLSVSDIYYRAALAHLKGQSPQIYNIDNLLIIPIIRRFVDGHNPEPDPMVLRQIYVRNLPSNWFEIWMNSELSKAKVRTVSIN